MWDAMEKTRQFGFGPEVKRRIMLGTYALSSGYYDAYYLKAQRVRTLIRQEFDKAFEKYDALLTPTSPTVPFKIGEKTDNPLQMYLSDVCTLPINIAGVPAYFYSGWFCAVIYPSECKSSVNLSVRRPFFRIAYTYEQAAGWQKHKPKV